jgi:biotin transport system substrate-specific component
MEDFMKAKNLILVSMFAALTAIGAFIKIPVPYIPFTLQFLFCAFAGILLGARLGAYSQLLYVLIGLVGIPVFTQGGGPNYIFKPSFGYLLGFIVAAFVIGKITEKLKKLTFDKAFLAIMAGIFCLYLIGVTYMYFILNLYLNQSVTIRWVVYNGAFIFLPKEIVLATIIAMSAVKIRPIIRAIEK